MRIITAKGEFILPADFEAQLSCYNVMISTAGEQTAPVTLPGVPENMALIDYSNRLDAAYKPLSDLPVTVIDGLFIRQCNLGIHTADEEDGISCTLYFDTGEFYSLVGEQKIATLPWPIYKSPTFGSDTDIQKVTYLINKLKANDPYEIFVVCPILTTQKYKYRITKNMWNSPEVVDIDSVFILNWFDQYHNFLDFQDTGFDTPENYQAEYEQQIVEGENVINLGLGYGMTPFLKLSYVLTHIFESYGYSFDTRSIEDGVNEFSGMFILNNVADAIYSGILRFSQLLPDMTIKQFIAEIEKWFCGKFIFNSKTKSAYFEFFQQLSAYAPQDLTPYLAGKIKIKSAEFKRYVLNMNGINENISDENVEKIDFSFLMQKQVDAEFMYTGSLVTAYKFFRFNMLSIDGIIHKNTGIMLDGVVSTEEAKSGTVLQVGFYNGSFDSANPTELVGGTIRYTTSYPLFGSIHPEMVIDYLYTLFLKFKADSNIPFEVNLNIPPDMLEQMPLFSPKLIHGQVVLLENIITVLGNTDEKTQMAFFRTLRPYVSR